MLQIRISANTAALTTRLGLLEAELRDVTQRANKEIAAEMKDDFARTTASWNTRPAFTQRTVNDPLSSSVAVGTDDQVWKWLDQGTKAHGIQPKGPGYPLKFQWGGKGSYIAKTTPGQLTSQGGGPSGPTVRRMWVWHPGTRPRFWSVLLQRKWNEQAPVVYRRYIAAWIRSQRG